jgi:hypothetical protein
MAGKLKLLDVERETRPGKYADGNLSRREGRDVEERDLSIH